MKQTGKKEERPFGLFVTALLLLLVVAFSVVMILELLFPR